jgi:hypothetical protein
MIHRQSQVVEQNDLKTWRTDRRQIQRRIEMATYHDFDDKAVASALEAARNYHNPQMLMAKADKLDPLDDGHLSLAGGCISVTVQNGSICVNLPLGIGSICLPIPSIFPNGTAAQACVSICTTWGIPTGVKVTISIAGVVVVQKTFLKC